MFYSVLDLKSKTITKQKLKTNKTVSQCQQTSILSCSSLVELSKPHANTHRVLQKFFCTSSNTCFLLLLQGFMLKRINTIVKASLHQVIIHSQAAMQFLNYKQVTPSYQMTINAIHTIKHLSHGKQLKLPNGYHQAKVIVDFNLK